MSPGFRLLPPAFTPPSPGSAPFSGIFSATPPASPLTATSPWTEEEGRASFEAPPTAEEGSILSNTNIKERARHSIRRRPPSRRHRKSSHEDEAGVAIEGGDPPPSPPPDPEDTTTTTTTTTGGGDETDASTRLQKNKEEEDESKISVETRGDEEMKEGSKGGEKGEASSSEEAGQGSAGQEAVGQGSAGQGSAR
ncbi:hypothetical protein EYF80_045886 [Liparis tanakae]|uniref:Uncharacterized protein n=1 Tax=Liparis tanakae TaxID=230148 RepID=A0A4Z2FT79_9TELE|nr:hypothetical protein EYF80_045886 [Liparis tanakae]